MSSEYRRLLVLIATLTFGSEAGRLGMAVDHETTLAETRAIIDSLVTDPERADSAIVRIDRLLPGARDAGDPDLLLFLLSRRGRVDAYFDRAKESEPPLREALDLAEQLGDTTTLCMVLRWLGVSVDRQGRRAEAKEINLRLLDLSRRIHDRNSEGWALFGLGWQAEQDGAHGESGDSYSRALEIFRETGDTSGEIWALNGIGSVAQRIGDLDRATDFYRQSMRRASEVGHQNGELRALNNLGSVEFLRGDPAKALEDFRQAYEMQVRLGNLREAVTPALNVAICQTHLGRYAEAEEGLRREIALCTSEKWLDLELSLRNQLARVMFNQDRFPESARIYRECLAAGGLLPAPIRIQASFGLSNALAKMDSSAAGLAVLDDLEKSLEGAATGQLRANLDGNRGLRHLEMGRPADALRLLRGTDAAAAHLGLSGIRLHALTNAAKAYRQMGMADSSRAMLEQASAVWEAERRVSANPDWRETRGALGRFIFTDLAAAWLASSAARGDSDRLAKTFDRLQTFKARTLLDRMRGPQTGATAAGGGSDRHLVGIAELQRELLRPGELFLDCYTGPEHSFVFAVTHEEIRWAAMPADSLLWRTLETYRSILTASDLGMGSAENAWMETARSVDSTLFGGVAAMLDRKERVFISADGPLHLIPYGVADLARGAGSSFRRWVRIPSATILSTVRSVERAPSGGDLRFLALGGRRDSTRSGLAGARREISRVKRIFEGVEDRLPVALDSDSPWIGLSSYDLIHFAAHARILDQAPWQSEIEIDAPNGKPLTAREVGSLSLRADLVVLSSCESARGRILSGEGVAGLTNAFLAAGARSVLATLWPVDDAVTAYFMERFYLSLSEGRSAGEALVDAQQAVRSNPGTESPVYWAGFVLVGDDGKIPVPPKGISWARTGILAAGGILLLVIGTWVVMRRRRAGL